MMNRYRNSAESFWARVDKRGDDECWPWKGPELKSGHGLLSWQRKKVTPHRLAFFLHRDGEEVTMDPQASGILNPAPHMFVVHTCTNRLCCNPAHLKLGRETARSKLTVEQVREIRRSYIEDDTTQHELGRKYGVTHAAINRIVKRKTYAEV